MSVSQGVAEAARNRLDLPFVSKCISMCVTSLLSSAGCTADIDIDIHALVREFTSGNVVVDASRNFVHVPSLVV